MEEKRFVKPEIIKSYETIIEQLWNNQNIERLDTKQDSLKYRIIENLVRGSLTQIFCIACLSFIILLSFILHFLNYIR